MTRDGPQTRVSPPDELLKGLLGERATGCWELELNGLGKSETHTGGRKERRERFFSVNGTFHLQPSKQDNIVLKA